MRRLTRGAHATWPQTYDGWPQTFASYIGVSRSVALLGSLSACGVTPGPTDLNVRSVAVWRSVDRRPTDLRKVCGLGQWYQRLSCHRPRKVLDRTLEVYGHPARSRPPGCLTANVPTNPGDNVAVNSWSTEGQRVLAAVDHSQRDLVTSSPVVAGGGR